ncbi:MAG: hypothetical protein AB7U30_10420 [Sulfuricellaceae bacterium]
MSWLEKTIEQQKASLALQLEGPMKGLTMLCPPVWDDGEALDRLLIQELPTIPRCALLYAVDTRGVQLSATITPDGVDAGARGRDRSHRPYLSSVVPWQGFLLSEAYISEHSRRPRISAVQAVSGPKGMLGFLVAEFDLRDLQLPERQTKELLRWRQIKGDPAIRETVFLQQRVQSAMDRNIEAVISIMEELMRERGIFHAKLHFSSSRATLWAMDDPYCYRLHVLDEIIDPYVCLAYPRRPYPERATVAPEKIRPVFEQFRRLREGDEVIYLRSGSLNIINGMVGLTFSCDGSHYLPVDEFLGQGSDFWFGTAIAASEGDASLGQDESPVPPPAIES